MHACRPLIVAALAGTAIPALAADLAAAPPVADCPDGAVPGTVFHLALGGHRAGYQRECRLADGASLVLFEFNDRGRGPSVRSRIELDGHGVPVLLTVDGHDYLKSPIAERFAVESGKASWRNKVETGTRAVAGRAFYLSQSGTLAEVPLLARAALAAPDRTLALLPSGEARAEVLEDRHLRRGGDSVTVRLVVLHGLGFQPTAVWLDDDGRFFASVDSWMTLLPDGWAPVAAELLAAQEAQLSALRRAQAERLRQVPQGALLVERASVFDAGTATMQPNRSVLVDGAIIRAVGPDGSLEVPPDARRIDAAGRALVPGLWDMHAHPEPADGLLLLAAGVTGVRDLAADPAKRARMRDWDAGTVLGPRIVFAGIVDGPGPFQGPTPVLVATDAEARAAVAAMADAGFAMVKVYSSVKPELVPAIVDEAGKRGLRVGGHVPAGMTAEQAVRAGFDEIQHMNMLFLNFMFDRVPDTRTAARLTAVAEGAAGLDLDAPATRDFVRLLAAEEVTVDPTLQLFENLILDRPGAVARAFAPIAERLPPSVRRGLMDGGLPVQPEQEQRYRDSFAAMLRMLSVLYRAGVPIVAGTDSLGGFALVRELELYVEAGLPAPEVLRMATLGAARAAGLGERLGSIAPGKLADFILVDGDPSADPGALRNLRLVVKDGVPLDPVALWRELGIAPLPAS